MKRAVYLHPRDPRLLIKIVHADTGSAAPKPWYKRLRRGNRYRDHLREFEEMLCVSAAHPGGDPPLPHLLGCIDTDLGVGLLSRAVLDAHGCLAPTLRDLAHAGSSVAALSELLATLLDGLLHYGVIVNDLNPSNVVLSSHAGDARLVLVDGFGEWNLVPRCTLSPRFNALNTRRRFAAMLDQLRGDDALPPELAACALRSRAV